DNRTFMTTVRDFYHSQAVAHAVGGVPDVARGHAEFVMQMKKVLKDPGCRREDDLPTAMPRLLERFFRRRAD
ncbi:MAG: hypothetical protein KGJ86_07535, partial [Chloroflexota bacterium]|nr:hypothetical protein [Chloroflexota bacterium]